MKDWRKLVRQFEDTLLNFSYFIQLFQLKKRVGGGSDIKLINQNFISIEVGIRISIN
jgi:hypothetical protein